MNNSDVNVYGGYITGFVNEFDEVPENLPLYSDYKKSLDNGNAACFELIRGVIEPVITQCLTKVGRKIVEDLWNYQLAAGAYRSPKELIEDVRRYLFHQRTILSGKLDELRKDNIENIGIMLPDEGTIKKYSDNLVAIAETSILSSFNTYTDVTKWNEACKTYLKSVKTGFFSWVFSGFHSNMSQEKFWQELKDKVIAPTVISIFNDAFRRGNQYSANDRPIRNAFTEIMRNFDMLFDRTILRVEMEINKLQAELNNTSSEHDTVLTEMQKLIDNTTAFQADIKESRDALNEVA
jgi:hypothetical protein